MSDYVTLMGSEEVSRAGNAIHGAACTMQGAANSIHEAIERFDRVLGNFSAQMHELVERLEKLKPTSPQETEGV